MREKIQRHAQRHSLLYIISFILLFFLVPAIILNYRSILSTRKAFYVSTLERQSLSELSLYSEGSATLANQYFTHALNSIQSLANDPTIQQKLVANQSSTLLTNLSQERSVSGQFDSLAVLSAKGVIVANSSDGGTLAPGTNVSQVVTYQAALHAGSVMFVDAHKSPLNHNVFSVVAPMRNAHGQLVGVVTGSIILGSLVQHLQLTSQYESGLSALLTDSAGNALVWQNKPITTILNETNNEPTLKALMTQKTIPTNEEYNFAHTDSFAQGTELDFGSAGKLYLVSFDNTTTYKQQIADAMQGINSTFSGFILRDGLFFIAIIIVLAVVIRAHEARHTL